MTTRLVFINLGHILHTHNQINIPSFGKVAISVVCIKLLVAYCSWLEVTIDVESTINDSLLHTSSPPVDEIKWDMHLFNCIHHVVP